VIQSVMSMAPLRVSLAGGGTDLPKYFRTHGGNVTSFAINKFTYVHVKRHDELFQEKYRISYSEVEHCNDRNEIKNDVIRSCLEYLDLDLPLQISTSADLPSKSGLGSSSSLMVALLHALHAMIGDQVSPVQLAEEAFEIETTILKSEVGKQDQYASAFGGINNFEFYSSGRVQCEPIIMTKKIQDFFENSLLLWTEVQRSANQILVNQVQEIEAKTGYYAELRELSSLTTNALVDGNFNPNFISNLVRQGWQVKQKLSNEIVPEHVKRISVELDNLNLSGHKLLGAGGGGFFLVLNASNKRANLEKKYKVFGFKIELQGSRIIHLVS
jgi:D-glycero-alpha-D-manno-heptose-7-phosphate kinase